MPLTWRDGAGDGFGRGPGAAGSAGAVRCVSRCDVAAGFALATRREALRSERLPGLSPSKRDHVGETPFGRVGDSRSP